MKVSYGTDVGVVRNDNQDSVFTHMFTDDCGLFIVADGMGGHLGGKTASSMAIDIISHSITDRFKMNFTPAEINHLMIEAVVKANTEIYRKSIEDTNLEGMGTTLVVMIIKDKMLYTVSVGDSRAYVCNGVRMYQITIDHSLVADLISKGVISDEEAKEHPQKNVITRAVGSEEDVECDYFETALDSGNVVLACSDGLHNLVSDREIAMVLSDDSDEPAQKLISLANERGGNDNITVVTVKIS